MKNTKNTEVKNKKHINVQGMFASLQSYVALVILGAFAFIGVQSLVDAKPIIQTGIGILVIVLLIKTVCKR